ncbi:MAG: hypothetical protein ACRC0G_12595 [Fusobacteriaceae bacterium]
MLRKETHKLRGAFRGTVNEVMTSGYGTPHADPALQVIFTEGYAPEGLPVVSNVGIAVGINEKGFLVPCDGVVAPYGIVAHALLGTESFAGADGTLSPSQTNGVLTGTDSLHQLTPTVYQAHTLFDVGVAFKTAGASAALFDYKAGDLLRPISKTELDAAIADGTLPVLTNLFPNETVASCAKTKAMYAGTMVKFNFATDDPKMKCARAAQTRNPGSYRNALYKTNWQFDYDLQGTSTEGQARHVFDMIGSVIDDAAFTVRIQEFYVVM